MPWIVPSLTAMRPATGITIKPRCGGPSKRNPGQGANGSLLAESQAGGRDNSVPSHLTPKLLGVRQWRSGPWVGQSRLFSFVNFKFKLRAFRALMRPNHAGPCLGMLPDRTANRTTMFVHIGHARDLN